MILSTMAHNIITKETITPDIFLLHNVLTKEECREFIELAESKGFQEATVALPEGSTMMKSIRNNQRVTLDNTEIATKIWSKVVSFIPTVDNQTPTRLNERIRFYKYEQKERFNKHRDGRFRTTDEESRLTFLIYLNDEYEGGETEFETFSTSPKTGTALCFTHELKHKGCSVITGTKYVLRTDIMFKKNE